MAEKHLDIQDINQRNEVLIKQLVDFHNSELRHLRDQLLNTERELRDKDMQIHVLEFKIRTGLPDAEELQWSEQERIANMN